MSLPSPFRLSATKVTAFWESACRPELSDEVRKLAEGAQPPGYVEDHNRCRIGSGPADYAIAKEAITQWRMFALDWLEVYPPAPPIAVGTTVVILAHVFTVWVLNPARIIGVIDESGPLDRYGFTYAALPDHAQAGIESFTVEWHDVDDSVWYDIHSLSRPAQWFTKMRRPFTRHAQRRFARGSMAAIKAFLHAERTS